MQHAEEPMAVGDTQPQTDTERDAADTIEDDDDGATVHFRPWPPGASGSGTGAGSRLYAVQMHVSNASGRMLAYKFRANVDGAFRIQPHSTGIVLPRTAHTVLILWQRPERTLCKARLLLESKFVSTAEVPSHTPLGTVSVHRLLAAASPVDTARTRLTASAVEHTDTAHGRMPTKCELLFRTDGDESRPTVVASGTDAYKSSERPLPPTPPPTPVSSDPPSAEVADSPRRYCVHTGSGSGSAPCPVPLRCSMAAMLIVIGVLLYFSLHVCVHFTLQMPRQYYVHDA